MIPVVFLNELVNRRQACFTPNWFALLLIAIKKGCITLEEEVRGEYDNDLNASVEGELKEAFLCEIKE